MLAVRLHKQKPNLIASALIAVLAIGSLGRVADLAVSTTGSGPTVAGRFLGTAQDGAEHAIYLGGIVLERNRHLVVGGTMGCAVGAAVGAGVATVAGVFSGGVGFALIPTASMIGCGLGGVAGGAVGRPLDDYASDLSALSALGD